jgi:HK97 gp10 family phage protein
MIQIKGLEEVLRRMRGAADHIVIRSYARALDRAAGIIAAEVERRAETLPEVSDTPLHEHVTVKTEVDTQKRGGISRISFDQTPDARTGIPQDLKALFVEAGHKLIGHHPGDKNIGQVTAHPFMRPAFEASREKAVSVFAATLKQELDNEEQLP